MRTADQGTAAGVSPADAVRRCASCGRESRSPSPRGWAPIITRGDTVGHTCQDCPRAGAQGEPIVRWTAGGPVRFRVRIDRAPHPVTGKRRQLARIYDTLAEARAAIDGLRAEVAEQDEREAHPERYREPERVTVDAMCDRWLAARRGKVRPNTLETYEHRLKPVRRFFGDRLVSDLQPTDVEALAGWLAEAGGNRGQALGSAATRGALTTFSMVMERAVKVERIVPENVIHAADVALPRAEQHAPADDDEDGGEDLLERWTEAEWRRFVRHADGDALAAAWRLSALGLRREEVLGLRWSDVSFDTGEVRIRQTRVKVGKGTDERGWILGGPKSRASRRTIRPDNVLPGTMELLRSIRGVGGRLVVLDALGEPVGLDWYSDRFAALCKAANVPVIHLHSTRHTLAYFMTEQGIPAVNAAAFLGHTTQVFTNIYLRHKVEGVEAAEARLGALFAGAAES